MTICDDVVQMVLANVCGKYLECVYLVLCALLFESCQIRAYLKGLVLRSFAGVVLDLSFWITNNYEKNISCCGDD